MEYRRVGRSGLRVSAVSVGGWLTLGASVDHDAAAEILEAAVEGGVNFIDLADIYAFGAAESAAGRFLERYCATPGNQRSDLVISSKAFWPMSDDPNDQGLSRKHLFESVDKSLRRLHTDYLDIYFCHRFDPDTPLAETARAMNDLVAKGKVLYWGTSVWTAAQLTEVTDLCERRGWVLPIVEQPRYNLVDRSIEDEVLPAVRDLGMGLVCWSPLAQGLLTGKYDGGVPEGSRGSTTQWLDNTLTEANLARVRELTAIAADLGVEVGSLALAWLLLRPGITSVITGATRPEQVRANLSAATIELDDEVVARIGRLFAREI